MIERYRAEVDPPLLPLRVGSTGPGVKRVQEWLCLDGAVGVAIDGEFGPATAHAVSQVNASGSVDLGTWNTITHQLQAVADAVVSAQSFGQAVVCHAQDHLSRKPREAGGDNRGPWVRHYCRGQEVAWCQGFTSTIWADAARRRGESTPLDLMLDGLWCLFVPRMAAEARAKGRFIDGQSANPQPPAGSMFFLRGGAYGYLHVGIVESLHGDGLMTTIEGNTNEDGSANGYEVARRVRRIASCDFGSVA